MFIIDNWLVGQLKKFLVLRQEIWLNLRTWFVTSSSGLSLLFFIIDYSLGSSLNELMKKCLVKRFNLFFFFFYNHFWSFKFLRQIDLKRKHDLILEKWLMLTHSYLNTPHVWSSCYLTIFFFGRIDLILQFREMDQMFLQLTSNNCRWFVYLNKIKALLNSVMICPLLLGTKCVELSFRHFYFMLIIIFSLLMVYRVDSFLSCPATVEPVL